MDVNVAAAEPVLLIVIDHLRHGARMFFGRVMPLNGSHSKVEVLLTVSAALATR